MAENSRDREKALRQTGICPSSTTTVGSQVIPVWIDFDGHITIRGDAVEITKSCADPDIDRMTKKYLGKDCYSFRTPGEVRVIFEIRPVKSRPTG